MARSDNAQAVSLTAGEAISIFRFVGVSAANTVTMTDNAAADVIGVSGEAVASGDVLPVNSSQGSIVLIELGATLAAGAEVSSGTDGVAAAASTVAGEFTCGTLLEGGDAGDVVSMVLNISVAAGS